MILEPMHNLLRKGQKFVWTKDCQKSFDEINSRLCSKPVLEVFDEDLKIHFHTNASLDRVGEVLK